MAERPNTQQEEDNLTRFRLVHPDKDLRALTKRLHRLPHLAKSTKDELATIELEKEALEVEVMKFAAGVERTARGAHKLGKQREHYIRQKESNLKRAEALSYQVAAEEATLAKRRSQLAHAVHCDSLAEAIRARTQSRTDLDRQIAELQASVASHRATHAAYLETAQARIEAMAKITAQIQEAQAFILAIDPDAAPPAAAAPGSDLNAAAAAFRPKRTAEAEDGEVTDSDTRGALRNKKRKPTPDAPRRPTRTTARRGKLVDREEGEHSA